MYIFNYTFIRPFIHSFNMKSRHRGWRDDEKERGGGESEINLVINIKAMGDERGGTHRDLVFQTLRWKSARTAALRYAHWATPYRLRPLCQETHRWRLMTDRRAVGLGGRE